MRPEARFSETSLFAAVLGVGGGVAPYCLGHDYDTRRYMYGRALGTFVAVASVAGCGGAGGQSADPSPKGSPTQTEAALPPAADGDRLSACLKKACEVVVAPHDKIHPPTRLGVKTVVVQQVSASGVTFSGVGPGIALSLGGQQPGMTSYMNHLAISTVAVGGGKAVVRFAPKTPR